MTNTPKHIRKKIERYVVNKYSTHDMSESEKAMLRSSINVQRENSIEDVSYGYSLAMQQVGEKDKEIERLRYFEKSAIVMINELLRRHRTVMQNLDISNEHKCGVLNYMGWSCDSFEGH